MDNRRDEVVAALKAALDLICARGYQPLYGSAAGGGPINISNALTRVCHDYDLYLLARQSFSKHWGGPVAGLLHWETEKRRNINEVKQLIAAVLKRLETHEAHPVGSREPRTRFGST